MTTVSDAKSYLKYYAAGRPVDVKGNPIKVERLSGRILRGKTEEDFSTLSNDPARKVIMLLGADGLETLLGLSHYHQLIKIGYPADWTEDLINDGIKFKLVIFDESDKALPATWENLPTVLKQAYPELPILEHVVELKQLSFDKIQKMAGYDFQEIQKLGKSDPRYMTAERFKEICDNRKQGDSEILWQMRSFLFFTCYLNKLFSGDGYTYDANGNKEFQESITLNLPISELGGHLIDMNVPKL